MATLNLLRSGVILGDKTGKFGNVFGLFGNFDQKFSDFQQFPE